MAAARRRTSGRRHHIAFVSSNVTWGGSEDLWSGTAAALAGLGHRVTAYKNRFPRCEANVARLDAAGCRLVELARFPLLPRWLFAFVAAFTYPLAYGYEAVRFYLGIKLRRKPDLLVVSQGGNHDGWLYAAAARRLRVPYVLISQKATDLYWPLDTRRDSIRLGYQAATWCFFVSEHNRRLTEEQLGMPMERATVVRNPFKVRWAPGDDWPGSDFGFRLACVGRLYPMEKGQDLLFRVLARDKWRARPVSLTLFGSGEQEQGLKAMAEVLGLTSVRFGGFTEDVDGIWDAHHALVLPSRAEGMPLVLVEAMLRGRVAIVTDIAGNAEVLEDDVTGFIAGAASEEALDEALERAWQRRTEWREIGARAGAAIRERVPPDPAAAMAGLLLELAAGGSIDRQPAVAPAGRREAKASLAGGTRIA